MTNTSPAATLPRIVRFDGCDDSGEYGNATCPHCGAKGRYVYRFRCEDGVERGAMAGCIQLFPVASIAREHQRIIERQSDRAKRGGKLAGWDEAKLAAIQSFYDGAATEGDTLRTIERENARRQAWMDRKGYRR